MNERILLVDRSPHAEALEQSLCALGYVVERCPDGTPVVQRPAERLPAVAMLEATRDGVDAGRSLGACGVPVVFLVHAEDDALLEGAAAAEPLGYLVHPVHEQQLDLTLRATLAAQRRRAARRDGRSLSRAQLATMRHTGGVDLVMTMLETIDDGLVVMNGADEIVYANPATLSMLGKADGETAVGDWVARYEFFHADAKTPLELADLPLFRAARGEATDDVEIFVRDGDRVEGTFLNVHGRPLLGEDGTVAGAVSVIRDITASKAAETELRDAMAEHQAQNALMATVLDSIGDGLIVTDPEGRYLVFNRSAERLLGKPLSDAPVEGRAAAYGMYLPDGETPLPDAEAPLIKALRGEHTNDVEIFVRNAHRPEGIFVSASGRPLRDPSGRLVGATVVFRDVTQMRQARQELEAANRVLHERTQTMEAVFQGINDGVLLVDTEGQVVFRNASVDRMLGKGMVERVDPGRWREGHGIFYPDKVTRLPLDDVPHVRALAGEPVEDVEMFIRNPKIPNGVHVSVDARPMYDPSGTLSGAVLVARDITNLHRTQQALTDAFAHGRLEVLDTIVHNVGNAINSVSIGVTTAREEIRDNVLLRRLCALAEAIEAHGDDWAEFVTTDPQGRKVLPFVVALAKDFERQNAELARVVDRVADRVRHIVEIVRTQPSHFDATLARADIVLEKAVTDAAGILWESLAKRGIDLTIRCATAPREIRVQESKFHQLVVNLVKNAMDAIEELGETRATPKAGEIGIDAYLEGDSLVIDVSDNGIGIDPSDFRSIFFPGYTTKADGTGLGLHSAANYVIGSGGTIRPLSAGVGHGATLRVAWKAATIVPPDAERAEAGTSGRAPGRGA